jgi:hypothetical protein
MITEVKRNKAGGAFQLFHIEKSVGKHTIVPERLGKGGQSRGLFFTCY